MSFYGCSAIVKLLAPPKANLLPLKWLRGVQSMTLYSMWRDWENVPRRQHARGFRPRQQTAGCEEAVQGHGRG